MKKILRYVKSSSNPKPVYQVDDIIRVLRSIKELNGLKIDDISDISGTPCIRVGNNKCYLSEPIFGKNPIQKSH